MTIDAAAVRHCLKSFDFDTLFREHLGWDKHRALLDVPLNGDTFRLTAVAQKRGFAAYVCPTIPERAIRLNIDRQVAKIAREHLVIYADQAAGQQVWQWVRREPGKPLASRDHRFDRAQSGDPLIQRLAQIAVAMREEDDLTLFDVTRKAKSAFDIDQVTKKFYERFKAEHTAFMKFIKGIRATADLEWYTSLMLNRLMFVYFIQKKGFLDGDTDYLRHRMRLVREAKGSDQFQSFYRYFLLRLFHDGLGKSPDERQLDPELEKLLGQVPYLNGGFFEVHPLEERNAEIDIPDQAFTKLFEFFEDFRWHLDERPLRADNEINPDVVGYIFEKYINQKQMGAYYTKEDITEYISKNTIIPFLFDAAEKKCPIAFTPGSFLWRLLSDDPDRYLYAAMRQGVIDASGEVIPLPAEIEAGVSDVAAREGWNKPAAEPFALPTETWREHVARRTRCLELRAKLKSGEVRSINDLITLNLDVWQFARDGIVNSEGPELLRAFWQAIEKVTVLDPTCGSGAFLFAALRILETLYGDCLERMARFVEDLSGKKHHPEKFHDFKAVLAQIARHPSDRYFILKSIIVNNLFGVDIMEEAVEICKLRLFLKLVAQVETVDQIEPLPDIDFNIRAGNTLVGYVSLEEIRKSQEGTLAFSSAEIAKIEVQASGVDRRFKRFRELQTNGGHAATSAAEIAAAKSALRGIQAELAKQLDEYLAGEYGIDVADKRQAKRFGEWRESHRPFHWFVDFYGVLREGGFDVVIGNPPYVELSDVRSQYTVTGLSLTATGNLYALCAERCRQILHARGRLGVITPISAVSTPRMLPLMRFLVAEFSRLHTANFAVRPGKLFNGVDMNLTILLGHKPSAEQVERQLFATQYNRWQEAARSVLFETLSYGPTEFGEEIGSLPKIGSSESTAILAKMMRLPRLGALPPSSANETLYYHSGGRYFRKCLREKLSNEYKELYVPKGWGDAVLCLLSSSLYYWFWIGISDCYHVTKRDIGALPVPESLAGDPALHRLAQGLLKDLWAHAQTRQRSRANGEQRAEVNFDVSKSKPIIDKIDSVLARHYNLSDAELELITNYDVKYRGNGDD